MFDGKTILAIIPARGGSKGVPYKNIRNLAGKPLIAWTIEEAKKSKYIDRLILSSEDEQIIKVAKEWGCEVPFVRPAELAQDDTPGIEPVLHAIRTLKEDYDYIVLLQPTSPMRTAEDIDGCIEQCILQSAPACVSVCEVEQSPYWMYHINEKMRMIQLIDIPHTIVRRQDLPPVYVLNGAIYIAKKKFLMNNKTFVTDETLAYPMPTERSMDVDNESDFDYCEWLKHRQEVRYDKG